METTTNTTLIQKTLTLKKAYQGPRCSVMNCDNSSRKRDELGLDISFHRFPRDLSLQKEWVRRCRPLNYANIMNRQVCSIHFEPQFFCKRHKPGSKAKLVEGTLPTVNLPPPLEEEEGKINDPLEIPIADESQSQPEVDKNYEHDIEMVELSSEDEQEIDVIVSRIVEDSSPALTSAAAVAATSALHVPPVRGRPPKMPGKRGRRKSSAVERTPTKSVTFMDGSMDSSRYNSEDELEDEEISLIPLEELEYIDLQDPLELAYTTWKNMNDISRRATIRAYLSRLASFLPPRFPRNNKPSIMESSMRYLDEVTKENAILAIEQELLMQRHYILRKKRAKLDLLIKKKRKRTEITAPFFK